MTTGQNAPTTAARGDRTGQRFHPTRDRLPRFARPCVANRKRRPAQGVEDSLAILFAWHDMIDVEGRLLMRLGETAVLTAIPGAITNTPLHGKGNVIDGHDLLPGRRVRPQPEQRQHVGEIDQSPPLSCLSSRSCSLRSTPSGSLSPARSSGTCSSTAMVFESGAVICVPAAVSKSRSPCKTQGDVAWRVFRKPSTGSSKVKHRAFRSRHESLP